MITMFRHTGSMSFSVLNVEKPIQVIIHKRGMRRHMKECHSCGMTTVIPMFCDKLKNHVQKHTCTGLYPCTYRGCTNTFTTKKGMLQHQDKGYTCNTCGKSGFRMKEYWCQHQKKHDKGFMAQCGFQGKTPTAHQNYQKIVISVFAVAQKELKDYTESYGSSTDSSSGSLSTSSSSTSGTSGRPVSSNATAVVASNSDSDDE